VLSAGSQPDDFLFETFQFCHAGQDNKASKSRQVNLVFSSEKKQVFANIHRSQKPVLPSSDFRSKINLAAYDINFFSRPATPSPAGAARP
jgi:hypothetical protein